MSESRLYTHERSRLATIQSSSSVLRSASLAPTTISAYTQAVSRFSSYCKSLPSHSHHGFPHRAAAVDLDMCVSGYISLLFANADGANKQLAVNTLYGIYLFQPEMRGLLRRSEQLLRGWSRLKPSVSHPPLTWPLCLLIAATMAKNQFFDCALATLVAFDGLLRVSELVNIRVHDVSALSDARRGGVSSPTVPVFQGQVSASARRVCIRLPSTKTGSNQWCELYSGGVGDLLVRWLHARPAQSFVFQFPVDPSRRADHYRQVLRLVCDGLGLSGYHYTPHSLRHGGATHAHLHLNQSIEHVMHRGRWRSNDSCRTYIQAGRAALLSQDLPSAITALATGLVTDWLPIMESLCFSD